MPRPGHKPSVIFAENSENRMIQTDDGRRVRDALLVVTDEAAERLHQGYQCAMCLEIFDSAFPAACYICGFRVKTEQVEYLSSRRVGAVQYGSRVRTSDEIERMRAVRDYEDRTGVRLPDSVRFPDGKI